ncbi:MAG: GNAT family N-acetyltransferase [Bryobacterales bacterium]|nr:GNAT family N-acetyltransferase [Bryobacterales bacterium]
MIYRLTPEMIMELVEPLSHLLWDAVDSGASIGFLPPVDPVESLRYWDSVRIAVYEGSRVLLAYIEDDEMVGTVQLDLAMRKNALHRAEVMKLMVHRNGRRRGVATALMNEVEKVAREMGRTLLVLDTRRGDESEKLYRKLGYLEAGEIPRYARSADGTLHATVILFKEL